MKRRCIDVFPATDARIVGADAEEIPPTPPLTRGEQSGLLPHSLVKGGRGANPDAMRTHHPLSHPLVKGGRRAAGARGDFNGRFP